MFPLYVHYWKLQRWYLLLVLIFPLAQSLIFDMICAVYEFYPYYKSHMWSHSQVLLSHFTRTMLLYNTLCPLM
jgi:hypothetical protein